MICTSNAQHRTWSVPPTHKMWSVQVTHKTQDVISTTNTQDGILLPTHKTRDVISTTNMQDGILLPRNKTWVVICMTAAPPTPQPATPQSDSSPEKKSAMRSHAAEVASPEKQTRKNYASVNRSRWSSVCGSGMVTISITLSTMLTEWQGTHTSWHFPQANVNMNTLFGTVWCHRVKN